MAVEIAIAAKPKGAPPMDDSAAPDAPDNGMGQDIADAAKNLSVDDLTTLMHGISPQALEVMEKIPALSAFCDFIENGGSDKGPDDQGAPNAPPAAPPPVGNDPRSQIAAAMRSQGIR